MKETDRATRSEAHEGESVHVLGKACPHEIHIVPTDNFGFIAEIGCSRLVFDGRKSLISGLREYLSNPDGWEKKHDDMRLRYSRPSINQGMGADLST